MSLRNFILLVVVAAVSHVAVGLGNGKPQIHFIDVGQGHGTVLISPGGQVVRFAGEVLKKRDHSPSAYTGSAQHSPERCA